MRIRSLGRVRRAAGAFWKRLRHSGRGWSWSDVPAMVLAQVVRQMAETGAGTDECLRQGCLPMLVHYYTPVPDLDDLRKRRIWDRRSSMGGIDLRQEQQLKLLEELGRNFGTECRWPHEPTNDPHQFFTDNSGFSYGCAASTHSIIRKFKPRRLIEVGSGASSRVIAAALRTNATETGRDAEYIIVDPYPVATLEVLPGLTRLVKERVEVLDVGFFKDLGPDDVLFVDSGHTVRIGGDVNFLILDVLPAMAPGVIAHFHDIPLPYEYAEIYATNPRFRMFWTEAYLLQAFLCHNNTWQVLLAMNFLMRDRPEALRVAWPHYDPSIHRIPSHSFWIRRSAA